MAEVSRERDILAEIRAAYMNPPAEDAEDVDDSDVIGFGQREHATDPRPPRQAK